MPRWSERITEKYLTEMTRCLRIGDVVISPVAFDYFDESIMRSIYDWIWKKDLLSLVGIEVEKVPPKNATRSHIRHILGKIREAYILEKIMFKKDPPWFKKAPRDLKLACANWEVDNPLTDLTIYGKSLEFTGIRKFSIADEELAWEVDGRLGIFRRLIPRAQLANLTDPVYHFAEAARAYPLPFTHSRYEHTHLVYLFLCLIMFNNRCYLSRYQRKHGRVAALLHDFQTPAGGDGTKIIDPVAFDEELSLEEFLEGYDWEILRRRFGLSKRLIIDIVRGRGILGILLDIADKIAYISRDLSEYLDRYNPNGPSGYSESCSEIWVFADSHPKLCTLWDTVNLTNGKVFFEDAERLYNFSKMHALLSKNFYHNPASRPFEAIVSNPALKYLYVNGKIKREKIIAMPDFEYQWLIENFLGIPCVMGSPHALGKLHFETFASSEEARRREIELLAESGTLTVIEDLTGKIKPATYFNVLDKKGGIAPFSQIYPDKAEEISGIIKRDKPVCLYVARDTAIKPEVLENLRNFRKKELLREDFAQK